MTEKDSRDPELSRRLGLFPLTNIVIANMIGAGIFTTSGLLMADLKNPLILIGLWGVGGVLALFGALSYGELGAAMPKAGGEYVFLSQLYHPLIGFLSGWVSFVVGFSAPVAASALGFSEYFVRAFPQLIDVGWRGGILTEYTIKKLLAILAIVSFTFIHLRGISFGAKVQNYLTMLKVGLVAALIVFGFALGNGDVSHFRAGTALQMDFCGWRTLGLSLMWIMFGYSGWNATVYIGSEVKDPKKNLPRSLLLGTGIVIAFYVLLNLLFVYAVPPEDMQGVISIGGLAMRNLFGGPMELVFSVLISVALFSSLSAFIILGPRVYYSMAKNGHFFRMMAEVNPRNNVPSKAILLQGAISIIMILSGAFDQILTFMGFSLGIFPILAVLGVFKLRRQNNTLKMPGFPFVQIVYISAALCMLVLAFFERPVESSIAIIAVLIGIPFFFLFQYNNHKKVEA